MIPQLEHSAQTTRTIAEGIAALPWFAHAAVLLAFGAGLVIWLSGWRLLRPGFVVLGLIGGAIAGHLWPADLRFGLDPWAYVGAGAILGVLMGWLAFRVLVANTLGLVGAAALSLGVAAFVRVEPSGLTQTPEPPPAAAQPSTDHEPGPETGGETSSLELLVLKLKLEELRQSLADSLDMPAADTASDSEPDGPLTDLTTHRSIEIVRAFARRTGDQLWRFWNDDLNPSGRALLILSSVVGFLSGLVLGLMAPKRAAAVTTAAIGPAVWIPAAAYLGVAMQLPFISHAPARPETWLLVWTGAFGAGLLIQLWRSRAKAQKKAE